MLAARRDQCLSTLGLDFAKKSPNKSWKGLVNLGTFANRLVACHFEMTGSVSKYLYIEADGIVPLKQHHIALKESDCEHIFPT